MSAATKVNFSAFDRSNDRHLYMKADGQRFGSPKTLKVCCDVKYDVVVTVKPPVPLTKIVLGGDDIIPDRTESTQDKCEVFFTWFTNGYQPTAQGKRNELVLTFMFENGQVTTSLQVKFYPVHKSSNLTWGSEVKRIELEFDGRKLEEQGAPFQNLTPKSVTMK